MYLGIREWRDFHKNLHENWFSGPQAEKRERQTEAKTKS